MPLGWGAAPARPPPTKHFNACRDGAEALGGQTKPWCAVAPGLQRRTWARGPALSHGGSAQPRACQAVRSTPPKKKKQSETHAAEMPARNVTGALCLFPLSPFLFRREAPLLLQPPGLGWLLLRRAPRLSHPRARKRAACLLHPESWQAARKAPAASQTEPSNQPSVVPAPPSRGARLARCAAPSATSGSPVRGCDLGFWAGFF